MTGTPGPVKAFVSVDMEGLPHVVSNEHTSPGRRLYDEARSIMTACVLSVVEELKARGAEQVVVADSHGPMINLHPEQMPRSVSLVRGSLRPLAMTAGSAGCDFAVFVGYHASPDVPNATFDHTMSSRTIRKLAVNGTPMSEFTLNAAILGEAGMPVVMVAGDKALLDGDVAEHTPWATRVVLKESMGRYSAKSPSMQEVDEALRKGAREAVSTFAGGSASLFKLSTPADVEVTFHYTSLADAAALLPESVRVGGSAVRFRAKTATDAMKTVELLIYAASGVKAITD